MKDIRRIESSSEWENVKQSIPQCGLIIFKYSTACPISRGVERNFDAWYDQLAENTELLCVKVNVRAERELSRQIARELQITHESPQAIWMQPDQKVLWHASHRSITSQELDTQLKNMQHAG